MIVPEEQHIQHYGTPRHSGRYPYGSGGVENKKNKNFLDEVAALKKRGMSDAEIAKGFNMSRNELVAKRSILNAQDKQSKILQVQGLKERGWGSSEIGRRTGLPESTVRSYLREGVLDKVNKTQNVANSLKDQVDKKGYIDVGTGVEHHIGVTETRKKVALAMLKEEGYPVYTIHVEQANLPGQFTKMQVLAKPGTTLSDVQKNRGQIKQYSDVSSDNGEHISTLKPPLSISSKRVAVNYGPDGGAQADGVIYVRPGVKDLKIGENQYAQVRIAVDNTHYIKGMAVYKEGLPPGKDLVFNTNKDRDVPLKSDDPKANTIFKPMSKDPSNPFGSVYHQVQTPDGKVTSAMNIVNEQGDWDKWSKTLSSQFLSKQSPELAQKQLDLTFDRQVRELNEIKSLTNPVVRKELLTRFGEETDSKAVHLKAANLPRQANRVLLPINSIKPNEIYAEGFRNGDTVALIRHPHGGTFEIPQLTVNNRNREAKSILGNAAKSDAVGIHHSVAERLSGADFDGDTVLVIPNNRKDIKSTAALEGLKGFDPQKYKIPAGSPVKRITPAQKQNEMGRISNLITDMTLRGANTSELSRAIRHSMVVIDSEKHNLDYRLSERENGIHSLKQAYQGNVGAKGLGASTLISRAKADFRIPQQRLARSNEGGPIDPKTGRKVFVPTGKQVRDSKLRTNPLTGKKEYVDTLETKPKLQVVPRLSVVDDAHTLKSVPGTRMETIYADHSNRLKGLGNEARKEAVKIKPPPASPSARKIYAKEVQSLNASLRLAERNAPLERQAQLLTQVHVAQARRANPDMDKETLKKVKRQALNDYRTRTGAKKQRVTISQEEWNAIQAGAIAPTKLHSIITNSDLDDVKAKALPKTQLLVSTNDLRRAKAMQNNGVPLAEIADALNVGLTTLKVSLG